MDITQEKSPMSFLPKEEGHSKSAAEHFVHIKAGGQASDLVPGVEKRLLGGRNGRSKMRIVALVPQTAEGKPVRGLVVAALAPGLDMRRLENRVAVRREHPDAAQGTTVIVYRNNRFPEPLVPDPNKRVGFLLLSPPQTRLCGFPVR
jgi:hypothetical protein